MGYIGKKVRLRRLLFKNSELGLIVPIDHGLTAGPLPGLKNKKEIASWIGSENISAVILHKGILERLAIDNALSSDTGVILHLNGMSTMNKHVDTKEMITTIERALHLGADAVSVQINFTEENYSHNMTLLGQVTDAANMAGLPVLTMLYDKVASASSTEALDRMHRLIRLVIEIGTDMVKIGFPVEIEDTKSLIAEHCNDVKIFLAGGEMISEEKLCHMTQEAMISGASGLCVGRNVFQSHKPESVLAKLRGYIEHSAR